MLDFLYTAVSFVLLRWHQFFTIIGLPAAGGLNWTLSVVFLVVTARLLLFRLFIRQVKYQRHMQVMQPKIQALREKYKNDRAEQQRQMMKLQQDQGFNPVAGCLPMFAQFPIFIALYHVLRHIAAASDKNYQLTQPQNLTLYSFTKQQTLDAANARLFGSAPLAARLRDTNAQLTALGGERSTVIAVVLVLVIISASATYKTQRLVRAGTPTQPEGTAATVQRLMLYAIPLFTLGSGLFFPLGVLLYWFTSNTWTMLQQFYINRFHPHESKTAIPVGTVGKSLAPPPGKRPTRDTRGRPSLVKDVPTVATARTDEAAGASGTGGSAPPGTRGPAVPRPGQKPARPAGTRPPAKRSKKRR